MIQLSEVAPGVLLLTVALLVVGVLMVGEVHMQCVQCEDSGDGNSVCPKFETPPDSNDATATSDEFHALDKPQTGDKTYGAGIEVPRVYIDHAVEGGYMYGSKIASQRYTSASTSAPPTSLVGGLVIGGGWRWTQSLR